MDVFQKNPILYFTKAKTLADIHMQIHTHKAKGIKTQQKVFGSLLKNSKRLTQKEKRHLLAILDQPQSMKLCHGDFHHGNLLLTKLDRVYILDWMDAFMGDPVLDIALTAVNAAVSDAPEHVPMMYRKLYEVLKRILALDQRILAQYPGIENDHLSTQLLLAAGIHLAQREGDYRSHRKYFGTLLEKHTYFVGYNQTK